MFGAGRIPAFYQAKVQKAFPAVGVPPTPGDAARRDRVSMDGPCIRRRTDRAAHTATHTRPDAGPACALATPRMTSTDRPRPQSVGSASAAAIAPRIHRRRLRPVAAFPAPELVAAAAALATFVAFASRFGQEPPGALDRLVSDAIADVTGPATDALLMPLDLGGYPGAYLPLAAGAALLLARRGRREAWTLPAAALGGWLAHRAAKVVYRRPRPDGRPGRRRKKSSSFPSGHTVGATALYGAAALVLRRARLLDRAPAVALGIGVPAAMGVSRVALDWHWATDVVAGWLLGGAVALAVAGCERVAGSASEAR